MSTQDLVGVMKSELKQAGITYSALATHLGLAESSVKRMFAKGDIPLPRIDAICRILRTDFAELARKVADARPRRDALTLEQEKAVVADRKLLLLAICCLSQWTFEQIVATYDYTEAEIVKGLTQLDRLGVIELRPQNRYRLRLGKTFRWIPRGPVMQYFREQVVDDYYSGGFDDEGEVLMLVHGQVSRGFAGNFAQRLQRLGHDFENQHLADQDLDTSHKRAYTLVIGMRHWFFGAFRDLMREASA
ncbi:MAG: helix-turn-helix domain-containing protein [Usitatibacter sp.]